MTKQFDLETIVSDYLVGIRVYDFAQLEEWLNDYLTHHKTSMVIDEIGLSDAETPPGNDHEISLVLRNTTNNKHYYDFTLFYLFDNAKNFYITEVALTDSYHSY